MATCFYISIYLPYILVGLILLPRHVQCQGKWLRQGRVPFPRSEGHDKFNSFLQVCKRFRSGDKSSPFPAPKTIFSKVPQEWLASTNQTIAESVKKYEATFQVLSGSDIETFYQDLCPYMILPSQEEQARQKGITDACSIIKDALPTGTVPGLPAPDALWDPKSPVFAQMWKQGRSATTTSTTSTTVSEVPTSTSSSVAAITTTPMTVAAETSMFLINSVIPAPYSESILDIRSTATPTPSPSVDPIMSIQFLDDEDESPANNTNGKRAHGKDGNRRRQAPTEAQKKVINALFVGLANTTGLNFEDELWNLITPESEQAFKMKLLDRLSQPWNDDQKSQFWRSFCVANQPRRSTSIGKGKKGKRGKSKGHGHGGDEEGGNGEITSSSHRILPAISFFTLIVSSLLFFLI